MGLIEIDGLLTIVLTLLLRCGYILIHISCIPTTNVNNIYTQYFFNIGMTSLTYVALGSMLALGDDWKGLMGVSWISDEGNMQLVRAWSVSMSCSSIVQLVTAGRIHIIGDIFATVMLSGILNPIVYHSAWATDGWMNTVKSISMLPYQDVAGGSVIHLFGGSFAFGALIVYGGRIINVNSLDHNSLAINAQSTSAMGYSLVIASTMGLMLQSPNILLQDAVSAQISCIIALATGLTITTLFYFPGKKHSFWTIIWILQGGLSSLIILASGIGTYTRLLSFFYSLLGVTLYLIFSVIIRTSGLEDYCNLISVHLIQGLVGTYLTSFNKETNEKNSNIITHKLLWQMICSSIILLFGILSSIITFTILHFLKMLRNKDDQKVYEEMGNFERGCCGIMRRTLDASTGNLIRPGFHTFLKFQKRRTGTPENNGHPPQEKI